MVALAAAFGAVGEDAEEPGLEGGAGLEAIDALEDAEPGLLNDVLGGGAVADVEEGEADEGRLVAIDKDHEGALVTGAKGGDEANLLV